MPLIETHDLTKVFQIPRKDSGLVGAVKTLVMPKYEHKTAVDRVSFQIAEGEIVGYIGVNSAGKSTTVKMLTGILVPTSGRVCVLGRDPHCQRVANAREVGVVFGRRTQLWWDLAFIESLNLVARIYQVPGARYKQLLDRFAEMLELKELLNTTVVLTTNDLGDIEELCRRVIINDAGRMIYNGPPDTRAGLAASVPDPNGRYVPSLHLADETGIARRSHSDFAARLRQRTH